MKIEATLLVLGAALIGLAVFSSYSSSPEEIQFQSFMEKYGVNYKDTSEFDFRLQTFKANLERMEEVASRNPLASFGVNKFADRTPEEFKAMLNYQRNENYADPCDEVTVEGTPQNTDWRGLMGQIQDQGHCGGCWAFAATAVTEGRLALAQGLETVQTRFSPQQLIDCDTKNHACNGGFEAWAFEWLETHGFCHAEDYPYTAKKGSCQKECTSEFKIDTCSKIPENNNEQAVIQLQKGPVDVSIDATEVQLYEFGIMTSCVKYGLNHAVTLVGYNSDENGQAAITIRNSWGSDWGENGNFRLAYEGHLCGWDEDAHIISLTPSQG